MNTGLIRDSAYEQFALLASANALLVASSYKGHLKSLSLTEKHKFSEGTRTYHISIIDYLQEWNLNKKTERFLKT